MINVICQEVEFYELSKLNQIITLLINLVMAKENLEDLSKEKLLKKKRTPTYVLAFVWTAVAIVALSMIFLLIFGRDIPYASLSGAFIALIISLIIFNGRKKIVVELEKRNKEGE